MTTICGANCEKCAFIKTCLGCGSSEGSPFGGKCIAKSYIKAHGMEGYEEYKKELIAELNSVLEQNGITARASALFELHGAFVNLAYPLPSGESVKFLNDLDIYLGTQIEIEGDERCIGAVIGEDFLLVCSYGCNGAEPELIAYKKRSTEN